MTLSRLSTGDNGATIMADRPSIADTVHPPAPVWSVLRPPGVRHRILPGFALLLWFKISTGMIAFFMRKRLIETVRQFPIPSIARLVKDWLISSAGQKLNQGKFFRRFAGISVALGKWDFIFKNQYLYWNWLYEIFQWSPFLQFFSFPTF